MPTPSRNPRHKLRLEAVLVILVLLFGGMTLAARGSNNPEPGGSAWMHPIRFVSEWTQAQYRTATATIQELSRLRSENAHMQAHVQAAAQLTAQNELLEHANDLLRQERDMKAASKYPLVTAEVIDRQPNTWFRSLVINRGSRDGVYVNMAVLNWQGFVGKVLSTTPHTATVQLLTDDAGQSAFASGAKLSTGEIGLVQTSSGGHVQFALPASSSLSVQRGQPVFTSGLGVLPPDLLIGYVDSPAGANAGSVLHTYELIPAVSFQQLSVVHVVLYPVGVDRSSSAP